MKKHILNYESIEVGLKHSLNLILISELFAWILIISLYLRVMCEYFVYHFKQAKAPAICHFSFLSVPTRVI